MLRRLYDWTMSLASGPRATTALGAVSFVESSVFPIPPDVLLVPMVIARPKAAWRLALICTLTSVAGAVLGYFIGAFLWEQVAQPVFEFYGYLDKFDHFREVFNTWGWWFVCIAGITPFPFKVITIASGVTGLSFPVFVLASLVSRGIRFFVVATLLYFFGPPVREFIEKRLGLVFTVFMVVLVGGFYLIKFV